MGHARALLGTPDRAFQEQLAQPGRRRGPVGARRSRRRFATAKIIGRRSAVAAQGDDRSKLRPPGLLELEELLGDYLETRVKITMGPRHGRLQVDFANLEDLERIYRVMTQGPKPLAAQPETSTGSSMPRRIPSTSARAISGSTREQVGGRSGVVAPDELAHDGRHPGLAQEPIGPAPGGLDDRGRPRAGPRVNRVARQKPPSDRTSGWRSTAQRRRALGPLRESSTNTSASKRFACAASTLWSSPDVSSRRPSRAFPRPAPPGRRARPGSGRPTRKTRRRRDVVRVRRSTSRSRTDATEPAARPPTRSRARSVAGPHTPSAVMPALRWKSRSARSVSGPRMPSSRPASKPSAFRRRCSSVTSSPRSIGRAR